MRFRGIGRVVAVAGAVAVVLAASGARGQNGYTWKSVAMGGGGYVTGLVAHPQQQDLVYARTDVGGFYRWDAANSRWIPLTDAFPRSQSNYYGGEAIALDPNNVNVVYIAAGKYSVSWGGPGALFKSVNQGATWTKLDFPSGVTVKMGGNEDQRWAGERLAVSPFNSNVVLFGSRNDGLWRTTNGGTTWAKVTFGTPTAGLGITVLAFDKVASGNVYAGVYGDGVYKSTNSGASWTKLTSSPANPKRFAIAGGTLFVSHSAGIAKRKTGGGGWTNVTPTGQNNVAFCGLSVNPFNSSEIIAARGETDADANSNVLFRSTSGGTSWTAKTITVSDAPNWWDGYKKRLPWIAALEFDPKTNGRVWLTDWFGVHRTDAFAAQPAAFTTLVNKLEEMVVFCFAAPPADAYSGSGNNGPLLLSGIADNDGFNHSEGVDRFPYQGFGGGTGPWFQDTYSIAYCPTSVNRVIRVGGNRWSSNGNEYHDVAVSTDHGWTWAKTTWDTNFPNVRPLRVAVSASDANNFVVIADNAAPKRSSDNGATYQAVNGLPNGPGGPWFWGLPLAADTVTGGTFYYYDGSGKFYRSADSGANFTVVNSGLPSQWDGIVKAVPGVAGEVWLALKGNGLHRSTNGGTTFTAIANVQDAHLIAFGKPATGSSVPALYLMGKVNNVDGIFRSLDRGATWLQINDPNNPLGDDPNSMEASQQQFGLVFVGTNGRGAFYGKP